jgi:hypothetical protein
MRTALALAALVAAAPAAAREVSGVNVPDAVTVEGKELKLNGAGVRKRAWIEVYVGALYLVEPSRDAEAIVQADAPKRVRMVFLRDVDGKSIMNAFREGFEKNSGGEAGALKKQLDGIKPAIGDVKKGGEIVVTYAPGAGTTVTGPGGSAKVEGKAFADALFRNWLGKEPADDNLKKKMLGR